MTSSKGKVRIVDITMPGDARVYKRVYEREKEKTDSTNHERMKLHDYWAMWKVTVILIVVGALRAISN